MAAVHGHWEALDVVSGCGTDWAAHGDTDNAGKKQWKRVEMVSKHGVRFRFILGQQKA